jgi:hypothetical protein
MRLNSGHPHRLDSIPESHFSCSRTRHRCAEGGEGLAVREDIKGGGTRHIGAVHLECVLAHGPRLYGFRPVVLSSARGFARATESKVTYLP